MYDNADLRAVMQWIVGGDVGGSSQAIACSMVGISFDDRWSNTPHDPSDLGRCLRLLARFPHWTPDRFADVMSSRSHEWRCFVEDWEQLAVSMADEVGIDWSKGRSAPKTYDLMKATERRAIETDPSIEITGRRDDGSITSYRRHRKHSATTEAKRQ